MKHVFVETNWVVGCSAPAYLRSSTALALTQRAEAGELRLHVPSVCFTEARHPILAKHQPRFPADSLRKYLAWATTQRTVYGEDGATVRRVLDRYEAEVAQELQGLDATLAALRGRPGLDVFALSDRMLERAVELSGQNLDLKPFDQAILAAVLVRAEDLLAEGADDLSFCELDADLQPWDRYGRSKQPLSALYDSAQVWVYDDFAMESPPRLMGFPQRQ